MASHSKKYTMFSDSPKLQKASLGVQNVAEFGETKVLKKELNAAGKVVKDITMSSGGPFFPTLDNPSESIGGKLNMDTKRRLISSISMIAPSPDWFTGLSKYRPYKGGKWLQSFTVDTYPWDAGTDSGDTYASPNSATNPKEPIYQISNSHPSDNDLFWLGPEPYVLPVGQWSCTKVEETKCKEDKNAKFFWKMDDDGTTPKTKKCRWLGKKEARKKFCSMSAFNKFIPSAGKVCRVTCETCVPESDYDDAYTPN